MDGHTVRGSATVPWSKDAKHTGTTVSVGATFSTSKGVLDAVFAGPPALDDPFQPTPYDDFLPPNNTSPEGEGYVRFSALPKVATATGTTITEWATVYFDEHLADGGSSLATNSWSNKVDSAAPTAVAVTAQAVSLTAAVPVTWTASDPTGVGTNDVQVASAPYGKPLGTYRAWKTATSLTKASWPGTAGGTYCFKVRAIDVLGNASAFTTAPVCTAVPLAASRFAFTPGFRKVAGTAAYIKIFYQSLVAGRRSVGHDHHDRAQPVCPGLPLQHLRQREGLLEGALRADAEPGGDQSSLVAGPARGDADRELGRRAQAGDSVHQAVPARGPGGPAGHVGRAR